MIKYIIDMGRIVHSIMAETYAIKDGFITFEDEEHTPIASFAIAQVAKVEREGVVTDVLERQVRSPVMRAESEAETPPFVRGPFAPPPPTGEERSWPSFHPPREENTPFSAAVTSEATTEPWQAPSDASFSWRTSFPELEKPLWTSPLDVPPQKDTPASEDNTRPELFEDRQRPRQIAPSGEFDTKPPEAETDAGQWWVVEGEPREADAGQWWIVQDEPREADAGQWWIVQDKPEDIETSIESSKKPEPTRSIGQSQRGSRRRRETRAPGQRSPKQPDTRKHPVTRVQEIWSAEENEDPGAQGTGDTTSEENLPPGPEGERGDPPVAEETQARVSENQGEPAGDDAVAPGSEMVDPDLELAIVQARVDAIVEAAVRGSRS